MKKLLLILTACLVGVAVGLVLTGRGQSSALKTGDCAQLSIPVNSDYNDTYDEENGTLQIDYTDETGDHTVVVDTRSPGCRGNHGVRAAIDHAEQAASDDNA